MTVSVLMPSRGRFELAKKAAESLGNGQDYELLVAIDYDDPQFEQYTKWFNGCLVMERLGYGGLHHYYNDLAETAGGDWLMLWNDDAIMETEGWTDIISEYDHTRPQVLNVWQKDTPDNLFPLISRKWYEIVGHFSLNTHADSWVQQIGERLNIQVSVPGIKITHQGEDLHDQTHNEVKQVVRETSARYRAMEKERIEDADKIRRWLDENDRQL